MQKKQNGQLLRRLSYAHAAIVAQVGTKGRRPPSLDIQTVEKIYELRKKLYNN